MKTWIFLSLFALSSGAMADSSQLLTIEGTLTNVTVGEFDPVVVGDACLVEMKTAPGETVGFLTDAEACADSLDELTEGRGVTVVVEAGERVQSRKVLSILKRQSQARRFFAIDFGAIENGLAD